MLKTAHTLQAGALPHCHVALLPRNDRNLAGRQRDKRRRGVRLLCSDTGRTKLNDGLPKIALAIAPIPLKLLEARRKTLDAGQPLINDLLMLFVEGAVLLDELHLPCRKFRFA